MESKWNTTFCRLRGRVCVKGGRGSGEGAGRIWARERLPRSLDFLDRSIRKFPGATEHLKRFSCFSRRNIQTEIDTGFRPSRSFFGNLNWFIKLVNEIQGQNLPGRDEKRSPLKTPAWEAMDRPACQCIKNIATLTVHDLFWMLQCNFDASRPM